MSNDALYLKPNVAPKPLLNRWPLWPQLIPPPWAALVIAKKHLSIMSSYLKDPMAHANAAKTPGLMGGPWIDYPTPRVAEIQELLSHTQEAQRPMIELAGAIEMLDLLLQKEGTGGTLESLYARIPDPLRGLVELVYDTNHHADFRFLEGLLYRSHFFQRKLQSLGLQPILKDRLPFERSTPSLDDGGLVMLDLPFDDPRIDRFFDLESNPRPIDELVDELGVRKSDQVLFAQLLSPQPPPQRHTQVGVDELRVRYFGHASVLIETRDVRLMTDPFLSYEYPTELDRYTFQHLPERIDFALITHAHNDHLRPETLIRMRRRVHTLVVPKAAGRRRQDPSLKLLCQALGFRVLELAELESIDLPGGKVTAVPFLGEHSDMDVQGKTGYHVALMNRSILCVADSCNVEPALYRRLHGLVGNLDILFVGMECAGSPLSWYYGVLFTKKIERWMDQSRRDKGSNCDQAMSIVNELKPKEAYVYAMGQEPWLNHVLAIDQTGEHLGVKEARRFVGLCQEVGVEAELLYGKKERILHGNQ